MDGHCGLSAWNRQSTIVLAKATHPGGPYTQVQTLWPAFSHEPSATRAPTGEYVVHFTSTAYGCSTWGSCIAEKFGGGKGINMSPGGQPGCECDDNSSWHDRCTGNLTIALDPSTQFPTLMSWAPHPLGPWSDPVTVYNGSDGSGGAAFGQQATGDTNFAGVINPNGSMVGMWRGYGGPESAPGTKPTRPAMGCPNPNTSNSRGCPGHSFGQYSAVAQHWREAASYDFGHATRVANVFPKLEGAQGGNCNIEDPTLWVDAAGVFHAIVHQGHAGGHATSTDGSTWHWNGADCSKGAIDWANSPWPEKLEFTGGRRGTLSAPDRERPHLIMGKDGFTPVAISTGFRDGPGDHTYTLVQETDLSKEEMENLY